jgi:hypothetical protein
MATATKSRDYYIEKIEKHLLKKYPGMTFKVDPVNEREIYIYCYPSEPTRDTWEITTRAGNIVTDALLDAGLSFYVMTG